MALITLNYDVSTGLKSASQMVGEISALVVNRGELDLLQVTVVSDTTSVLGSNAVRRSIVLETSAEADQAFPTDAAKISATAALFRGVLELQVPGQVTAHEPQVEDVTPLELEDLVAWWNAGIDVTLNASDGVTQWLAQGSSAANGVLIQSSATEPLYVPSDGNWNNQPVVSVDNQTVPPSGFAALSSSGFWDFLHDGGPVTVIVLLRPSSDNDASQRFVLATNDASSATTGLAILYRADTQIFEVHMSNGTGVPVVAFVSAATFPPDSNYWIAFRYEEGRVPNEFSVWINGVEVASGNGVGAPDPGNAQFDLEIGTQPGLIATLDATIPDVIITESYVPDETLLALGASFEQKYGAF